MKKMKGNVRFRWSTRRRLVVIIMSVFVALTVVVSVATFIIVDQQIDTVTIGRFTPEHVADEQTNSRIPPDHLQVRRMS